MAKKNNNLNSRNIKFIKLAYEQALINLGSTKINPSVGCIIVKNNSVISSGRTSFNGRPHAEANALEKKNKFQKLRLICNYGTLFSLWKNTTMYKKNNF